ncbi:MAG: cellulase family glycosylhydrolase [Capsulimonas sp.]|uniref:glycoside hydrolase family 5 protein n=1 Tax=Capsulimonas sp. TaxID=2494211 RepID=UPI003266AC5C
MKTLLPCLLALSATLLPIAQAQAAKPSMLRAQGGAIVDAKGKPVTLRGVNLGGWLVEEMWMQPFVTKPPEGSSEAPVKDHVTLWKTVEKRLGAKAKTRVQTAFRNSWIEESDFDRIQAAGFNCVRVPFLAELADEPGGLAWLDRAVSWADKRGMYVILDLHGAPGGQSDQDHTGQSGVNLFFKEPKNIEAAQALWTRLAKRYRKSSAVAGYDLLNEPMGAANSAALYQVQDTLYKAVRAGDPDHLVFIEDGYKGIQHMPDPTAMGWTNVVLSVHYYNFNAKTPEDQTKSSDGIIADIQAEREKRKVPYYLGEFCMEPHGTSDTLTRFVTSMQGQSISWSPWSYKVTWAKGGQSQWGLYSNAAPITPIDPFQDTEAQMIEKCRRLRTEKLDENKSITTVYKITAGKQIVDR